MSHCGDSGDNHSTTDRSLGRASFTHPEGWEITSETDIDPFYQFMLQTQRDEVCLIWVNEPDATEGLMDATKEFASAAQVDVREGLSRDTLALEQAHEEIGKRVVFFLSKARCWP